MAEPMIVWAARHGFTEMVAARISDGDDLNAVGAEKKSAIFYAVTSKNTILINLLIKRKANLNLLDIYGKAPIHYCENDSEIEMSLLNFGSMSRQGFDEAEAENKRALEIEAKTRLERQKQMEIERIESERSQLIEKHTKFLKSIGKEYKGVKEHSQIRERRITYCWSCHGSLDNAIDLECNACGWILCRCGACGCGRGQSLSSSPSIHYNPEIKITQPSYIRRYEDDVPF